MSEIFEQPFPVISLKHCVMREIATNDIADFYAYISQEEVGKYISDEELPKDLSSAKLELSYWQGLFVRKQSIFWGIEDPATGQLIGTAGFNYWNRDHAKTEISYDLSRDFWGRGIMTEVVDTLVKYGFEMMGVRRISATASVDNIGSVRVLEKNGFECEGTMKDYKVVHNRYHDFYLYAIINHM